MKAALVSFDNAIGFGEWRLFMSTHATQDLRDAFKKNADGFKAIAKKDGVSCSIFSFLSFQDAPSSTTLLSKRGF